MKFHKNTGVVGASDRVPCQN